MSAASGAVKLLDEIEQLKPEIVLIAHASHHTPAGPDGVKRLSGSARLATLAQGERALIERISATGAQVVMIADTPMLPVDPLDCLLQNSGRTDLCRWPKQNVFHDPRRGCLAMIARRSASASST